MTNHTFTIGGIPCIKATIDTVTKCIANPNFLLTFASKAMPQKPFVHMRYVDYPDSLTIARMGLIELEAQQLIDYYRENPNAK
jgi:hypothetical protein